jgi:Flp pilus assembly protein TadG
MNKSLTCSRRRRRGVATVEFAVCLPVIVLVVLGSIEAASMLFLRQAMIQSAYEGVKVAILRNADNDDAIAAAEAVIRGRNLGGVTISFDPPDIATAVPGDTIRVTAAAPGDANSFIPFGPFKNHVVAAEAVMIKE